MKEELELQLMKEFPFMVRENLSKIHKRPLPEALWNAYQAYGCDVGDGWYAILHGLCSDITAAYERAGEPVGIVVDQVKEKFARLRFYYHFSGDKAGIQAIDFLGGSSLRLPPTGRKLAGEIAAIVKKWEGESSRTCEICGAPGSLRTDLGYWINTYCEDCYTQGKENLEEAQRKRAEMPPVKLEDFLE